MTSNGYSLIEIGRASGPRLWVGHVPYRKRPALGMTKGSVMHVNAYFRSDEDMEKFLADFRKIFNVQKESDD